VLPALALVAGPLVAGPLTAGALVARALVARVLAAPLAPALADAAAPPGVSDSPAAAVIDWTFGSAEDACVAVATGSAAAAPAATIVVAPCVAADALSTTADASCVAAVPRGDVAAALGDAAPPFAVASEALEEAGPTAVEPDNGALATVVDEPFATRSAECDWPPTDHVVVGSPAKTADSGALLAGGKDAPTALVVSPGAHWLPGESEVAPPGPAGVGAPTEPAELAGLAEPVWVARLVGPAGGDRLPAGGKETPLAPPVAGVAALLGSLLRLLLPVT
jgi:hypothetical protein